MSVSSISSASLLDYSTQSTQETMQQEFQQLGQDLQSGNLPAAQSDFVTLQNDEPQSSAPSSLQSNGSVAQEFNQLSQDLQSGNLSAAQQDYATIQQDFQNQASQGPHHHHHGGGGSGSSKINQLLNQLGQSLESGNLSAAQTTYSNLQTDFQQFAQANGLQTETESQSSSNSVSVNS